METDGEHTYVFEGWDGETRVGDDHTFRTRFRAGVPESSDAPAVGTVRTTDAQSARTASSLLSRLPSASHS